MQVPDAAFEELLQRAHPEGWVWIRAVGDDLSVAAVLRDTEVVIGAELTGRFGLRLVVSFLIVKTLISLLSLGSGTSGGVLAPMFMMDGAAPRARAQGGSPTTDARWPTRRHLPVSVWHVVRV